MPGSVPAISLARERSQATRLADRHVPFQPAAPARHAWGEAHVLSESDGHRVERIEVRAGKTMPAHLHNHRSEHWTVLEGEAEVVLGDDVLIVSPDDSLYVPAGTTHGVTADARSKLVFVAVHFGDAVCDAEDHIGQD